MTNAASTSNPSRKVDVGSHIIGPNIVTVKMSGKNKYNMWNIQMECLLKSQNMVGFIDGQILRPTGNGKEKVGDMEAWIAGDALVKGWILGSISEEAFNKVVSHLTHKQKNTDFTAKDLWDELLLVYGPWVREQAVAGTKLPTKQAEPVIKVRTEDAKSTAEATRTRKEDKKCLYDYIIRGDIRMVIFLSKDSSIKPWDKLTSNGNTVLHVAVASSTKNHELLEKLLEMTPTENTLVDSDGNKFQNTLIDLVNSDGSTLLHVAAIGGNIKAVNILVKRSSELLLAKDDKGHTPLALSVSNMHTNTSHCLVEHMKEKSLDAPFWGKSGEDLIVLAISCQDFRLARKIHLVNNDAILEDSDAVLTALAKNFPRELNFWETRRGLREEFDRFLFACPRPPNDCPLWWWLLYLIFIGVCSPPFLVFYQFSKVLVRLFIKDTSQIHADARQLLTCVSNCIYAKDSSTSHLYCTNSIFEATRQNTPTFVRVIVENFEEVFSSKSEDGLDFIQYSVINRSEKIYNLLYEMSGHKNIYRTIKDRYDNNLLHLAARLAPANKLKLIRGAALQIQREVQWFKEVGRFVCRHSRMQTNVDGETPDDVFEREHRTLLIEGENWIKNTANSSTIIAALIITAVFAAAITVPGGNNQESGIPIFTNNIAFTVFAISNATSLYTAVTSLLMFLSILTARYEAEDFLYKLPTKLIIGLTMLFLSTTAMIIAFGATLFLVFGQSNPLMLIPIGALTCLPIISFANLQFPLIVELISATYCGGFFGRQEYDYFY